MKKTLTILFLFLSILISGCGGGGEEDVDTPGPDKASTTTPTPAAEPVDPGGDNNNANAPPPETDDASIINPVISFLKSERELQRTNLEENLRYGFSDSSGFITIYTRKVNKYFEAFYKQARSNLGAKKTEHPSLKKENLMNAIKELDSGDEEYVLKLVKNLKAAHNFDCHCTGTMNSFLEKNVNAALAFLEL